MQQHCVKLLKFGKRQSEGGKYSGNTTIRNVQPSRSMEEKMAEMNYVYEEGDITDTEQSYE